MAKSFNEQISDKNNLMIVDGFNLAFRWKHAGKRNFASEYLQTIMSLANSYKAKRVVVLSDGGSKYRKAIYPEYKNSRDILRQNQTEDEAKAFQEFLLDWQTAFELCGTMYTTIQYSGVEADDIAAYITISECVRNSYDHIWLISSDRDWDLLVDDKASRFSFRTRKEISVKNWDSHYGYSVEDHISVKVLQGDKSDDIPGVSGIGEKRAAALVKEYGSALDIYASLPINDKRVFMQNLNSFKDQILVNYQLMDLREFSEEAIGDHITDLNSIIENELCQ